MPGGEGGGGGFLLKIPRGVSRAGGGGGGVSSGREGVCGDFGGGGAKYFFSGPKFPPRKEHKLHASGVRLPAGLVRKGEKDP